MRGGVRLRRSVHRLGLAAARRAPGSVRVPRLLSIVVTVRDAEAELDECLTSLREQGYWACEIVVVDLGLPAYAADVVERHAREDFRVRVLRTTGGLATGRSHGANLAVGEFLAFLDADDAVTRHGFSMTIRALRESGSDLAVAAYRATRRGHTFPVSERMQALHSVRRLGTSLEALPDLLANTVTGARVFRRRAYDEGGWAFPDLADPDDAQSVAAYRGASAIDVLTHVLLLRREQSDRSPLTRRTTDPEGLRAFAAGVSAASAQLPERLAAVYAAEVLAGPAEPFLDRAWRCTDEYWTALREVVTRLRTDAADEARSRVPAYRTVVSGLVAAGDRDRVRDFLTEVRPTARRHATTVTEVGGRPAVVVDFGPAWAGLPAGDRVLADREVDVRAEVTGVRSLDGGVVELAGWAFLDNVDLTGRTPSLRLVLSDGTSHVELPVTPVPSPEADVASDLWFADVTRGGFRALLDPAALPVGGGLWHLVAEVDVAGLSGAGRVAILPWTMAGVPAWSDASGRVLSVDHDDAGRFELRVSPSQQAAADLQVDGDVLTLALPAGVREVVLEPLGGGGVSRTTAASDGRAELSLADLGVGRYAVAARGRSGPATRLLQPPGATWTDPRVRPDRRGELRVSSYARAAEVVAVDLGDEVLRARLSLPPAVTGWEAALVVGDVVVPGSPVSVDDGLAEVEFSLVRAAWGRPELPLPSGRYAVSVRNAEVPAWQSARPAPGVASALPVEELQHRMRLRVEAFAPDEPGVRLVVAPPLADDELGQRQQRLLREQARVEVAERDAVFFRAMFSEFANGNGLGLHEELVRRGSSLDLLWSVVDRSVPVPPGGTGVVERSRAWHEAVARARYHVVDVHQLEWFVRPRDQVLIQTFHGYPYKVMGHAWWEKMGNSVQEIGSLDRRTREWSALVSPAPYATPLLRAAFLEPAGAGDVPVLETGYPRNDVLLRPGAPDVRRRARASLGLADDAVAVLYAPTFRDYLSPEDRTARTVSFFDADEALDLLPPHYVLLMRGHAFNARIRTDRLGSGDRVLDVTDHPDVNELVLASDAAVLDYSSLRFDYVLSGRPMVFLVPDLEEYDRTRGGVIPYPPTAPGPHTVTTRETATWLRDLPRLSEEYAEARERFRADFVALEDGRSAARLVEALFVPRGDG
jgi:CDP-glycerol glycerophosphotransferase